MYLILKSHLHNAFSQLNGTANMRHSTNGAAISGQCCRRLTNSTLSLVQCLVFQMREKRYHDNQLGVSHSVCVFQLLEESTHRTFSQDKDSEDDVLFSR